MNTPTHIVFLEGQASPRLVHYDGEQSPSNAQIRREFGLLGDATVSVMDIRRERITTISAAGKPDGLQHCSLYDLGAQLDMWTTSRFSPIYHVGEDLMNGTVPRKAMVSSACEELREIEAEPGEVLEEEAEFAQALAAELERRFYSTWVRCAIGPN